MSEDAGDIFPSETIAEPVLPTRSPKRRRVALFLIQNLRENMDNFPGFLFLKIPRVCIYGDKQVQHMGISGWGLGQEAASSLCREEPKRRAKDFKGPSASALLGLRRPHADGPGARGRNPRGSFPICVYMF